MSEHLKSAKSHLSNGMASVDAGDHMGAMQHVGRAFASLRKHGQAAAVKAKGAELYGASKGLVASLKGMNAKKK